MGKLLICTLLILKSDPGIYITLWFLSSIIMIITLLTIDLFQYGTKEFKRRLFKDFPFIGCLLLILFGLLSCVILIIAYINVKKKEREENAKKFPWWQLREYGGWK